MVDKLEKCGYIQIMHGQKYDSLAFFFIFWFLICCLLGKRRGGGGERERKGGGGGGLVWLPDWKETYCEKRV